MFDIGWAEMAVIALIALVVIGPKELPGLLRTLAMMMRKVRGMAREFQSGLDDMVREAELDEARKTLQEATRFDPKKAIAETVDPSGELDQQARDLKRDVDRDDDGRPPPKAKVIEHPSQTAPGHSLSGDEAAKQVTEKSTQDAGDDTGTGEPGAAARKGS